jgi:hypothetical protein
MTDEDAQVLRRENDYLKRRNAQLQDDVTSLGGSVRIIAGVDGSASSFWRSWPTNTRRYWVSSAWAGPRRRSAGPCGSAPCPGLGQAGQDVVFLGRQTFTARRRRG